MYSVRDRLGLLRVPVLGIYPSAFLDQCPGRILDSDRIYLDNGGSVYLGEADAKQRRQASKTADMIGKVVTQKVLEDALTNALSNAMNKKKKGE
mgnify:CR=1 FL=1